MTDERNIASRRASVALADNAGSAGQGVTPAGFLLNTPAAGSQ